MYHYDIISINRASLIQHAVLVLHLKKKKKKGIEELEKFTKGQQGKSNVHYCYNMRK